MVTANKKIILKPFINSTTRQFSVAIPMKWLKKLNPKIKFDDKFLVKVEFIKNKIKKCLE